jgi:hypothetical protein
MPSLLTLRVYLIDNLTNIPDFPDFTAKDKFTNFPDFRDKAAVYNCGFRDWKLV